MKYLLIMFGSISVGLGVLSITFAMPNVYGQVALALIGIATATFLYRLPSRY